MNTMIHIATKEIGTKEIPGRKHNQRIVKYAKESGFSYINDDETPWCSFFMNWVAQQANLESTQSGNARSWLNVGMVVTQPEPGDVVIFWRESIASAKGHVGLFMGYSQDHTRIYVLGGNQNDQVSQTAYPTERLLGFRRLRPLKKYTLSTRELKRGSTGKEVVALQDALKLCGYNPGTSDGIFGPRTEKALQLFQSTLSTGSINGIFDKTTRTALLKKIATL